MKVNSGSGVKAKPILKNCFGDTAKYAQRFEGKVEPNQILKFQKRQYLPWDEDVKQGDVVTVWAFSG